MSADHFRQAWVVMNLSEDERVWYPRWVEGYAGFHSMRDAWDHGTGELRVDQESGDHRLSADLDQYRQPAQ